MPILDKFIIGVDPGVPATLGLISPKGEWVAHSKTALKGTAKKANDPWEFARVIKTWKKAAKGNIVACVEVAHPRPREGVISVANYCGSYWMAMSVLATLGIPYHTVWARTWKAKLELDDTGDKSIDLAKKVFEGKRAWRLRYKKDHDFAEAALLAYYLRYHGIEDVLIDRN